ncbi:MAG TPA: UvrD-helicase domain-containing protein, partial [Planctomycetaceae bacterium]|nr:UvrD-helicase domain-containing protein [Planctomycetaceae bacterium]
MPGCDLQQSFANVVIRASAGTGKTFQLSNRFLALVHAGERPDHLIAATFARKAAGEILERVLLRLAEAATDPEQLRRLAGCIPADAGGGAVDRECCVTLLRRLVAHLHRLRIGTLDSLFVQMAGTFAFELGLPPGWRIVDEVVDRRLRDAAVQDVLAGSSASAVVTMMHLLNRGEARRSVSEQVRLVTDGLYTTFCEAALEAWDCIPRSTRLDAPQLRAAIARVAEFDGLPADKRFAAARAADVAHAEADDWSQFLSKGIAAKVHAGEPRYYGKDIPSPLVDAYEPLIEHARSVLIGQLADQTRATCALLEQFDRAYERLKHRERALRFEDVTRALARAVGDGRLGELAFRMDLNACQILLDEFQDTSLPQWQVLRPLAERAAREPGRSFFCVGDVKQAIYGWRGGVSELFEALGRQLPGLETLPLDHSFRSSQPVIDVVNAVFGSLGECHVLAKYPRVTNAWSERFRAHSTARDDLAGYVRI